MKRENAWLGVLRGRLCGEILRKHDASRILFATDTPWSDPAAEIAFIRSLGLSREASENILYRNAESLLGISAGT